MLKEYIDAKDNHRDDSHLTVNVILEQLTSKLILLLVLGIVVIVVFTGCTPRHIEPRIITETKIVNRDVPVVPKIPVINCDFEGEGVVPVEKLLKCLSLHKHILNFLRKDNSDMTVEDTEIELNNIINGTD